MVPLVLVLVVIGMGVGAFLWFQDQLNLMYGAKTLRVDPSPWAPQEERIRIKNVSILSPDGTSWLSARDVVMDHGWVISVEVSGNSPVGERVIDGRGRYLIPGLIDSHVHLWRSPNDLLVYLSQGVTGVREMMGSREHLRWRAAIEKGSMQGPHLFVASNKLGSFGAVEGVFQGFTQGKINLSDQDHARQLIDRLRDQGYDAIKIGSELSRECYRALNRVWKSGDPPLIGHLPDGVDIEDLSDSQQVEVAHLEELVKPFFRKVGQVSTLNAALVVEKYREESIKIAALLKANHSVVTTTLWLAQSFSRQKFDLVNLLAQIRWQYANPGLVGGSKLTSRALGWLPENNPYRPFRPLSEAERTGRQAYWWAYAECCGVLLKELNRNSVPLLAGTDANIPVCVPGFSLHDELMTLEDAGLTPREVLRSATLAPRKWMDKNPTPWDPGMPADFVLLWADPLLSARNLSKIDGVVSQGRYWDRQTLDRILAEVDSANRSSPGGRHTIE